MEKEEEEIALTSVEEDDLFFLESISVRSISGTGKNNMRERESFLLWNGYENETSHFLSLPNAFV